MRPLYFEDSYLKEFDANVVSVKDGKFIVLDKTAFYPNGGGQPFDTGIIKRGEEEFKVIFVGKFSGVISHEVDKEGLKEGDSVCCVLDWDRRYKLMRSHTAAHIVSAVLHNDMGALITGNQLDVDKVRIDFNTETYDVEQLKKLIEEANEVIDKDLELKVYYISREEAENDPAFTKLAKGLPMGIDELRVVEIEGFDKQADGGTHVRSTKEVGKLEFIKAENKGKSNRRVYFKLL